MAGSFEEMPATIAYAELVDAHLERLYGYTILLLGDQDAAEAETLAAFRRLWSDLDRGNVFGDATEILYRAATRGALRRLNRSRDLRGYLPPTTADDRLITATGIIHNFPPQQRAAILLAAWGGVGYDLAGIASGVGAARARDLALAARQEFRNERGGAPDLTPTCAATAPLLSARADGEASAADEARITAHLAECSTCSQTAALYDEFAALINGIRLPRMSADVDAGVRGEPSASGQRRPVGWRRIARLAIGPAILVVALVLGLFVFGLFSGERSIKTGVGRTPDVIYAREAGNGGVGVVDSGSGRRLGRLPPGVLTADGRQLYTSSSSCPSSGCTTMLSVADTGTLETNDVGRIPGRLSPVAVDRAGSRLYLADEEAGWNRLQVYDLSAHQAGESVTNEDFEGAFRPTQATLSQDDASLFTLGSSDGQAAIVRTDLQALRVLGGAVLAPPADGGIDLLPAGEGGRVLAYETGTGRLHEVDPAGGRIVRTLDLSGRAAPNATPPGGNTSEGTAAVGPNGVLYAAVRTGGIAVVDLAGFTVARTLNADRDYNTVSVSTDGRLLYVVESGGSYVVLDAATGNQMLRRPDAQVAVIVQVNQGE
jgi:DNA-directed RNA polymerase specialized sigma24 family protein